MTATLEGTHAEKAAKPEELEKAPWSAGELLCELLEANEALENHLLFGYEGLDDTRVVAQVHANLAMRIRKQALAEELVEPIDDHDGTAGRLRVGKRLRDAESAVLDAEDREWADGDYPTFTQEELAEAVREAREVLKEGSMVTEAGLLDEKLEAVLHLFEVTGWVPARMRRPSSYTEATP